MSQTVIGQGHTPPEVFNVRLVRARAVAVLTE